MTLAACGALDVGRGYIHFSILPASFILTTFVMRGSIRFEIAIGCQAILEPIRAAMQHRLKLSAVFRMAWESRASRIDGNGPHLREASGSHPEFSPNLLGHYPIGGYVESKDRRE
jgi:hypothetical protein